MIDNSKEVEAKLNLKQLMSEIKCILKSNNSNKDKLIYVRLCAFHKMTLSIKRIEAPDVETMVKFLKMVRSGATSSLINEKINACFVACCRTVKDTESVLDLASKTSIEFLIDLCAQIVKESSSCEQLMTKIVEIWNTSLKEYFIYMPWNKRRMINLSTLLIQRKFLSSVEVAKLWTLLCKDLNQQHNEDCAKEIIEALHRIVDKTSFLDENSSIKELTAFFSHFNCYKPVFCQALVDFLSTIMSKLIMKNFNNEEAIKKQVKMLISLIELKKPNEKEWKNLMIIKTLMNSVCKLKISWMITHMHSVYNIVYQLISTISNMKCFDTTRFYIIFAYKSLINGLSKESTTNDDNLSLLSECVFVLVKIFSSKKNAKLELNESLSVQFICYFLNDWTDKIDKYDATSFENVPEKFKNTFDSLLSICNNCDCSEIIFSVAITLFNLTKSVQFTQSVVCEEVLNKHNGFSSLSEVSAFLSLEFVLFLPGTRFLHHTNFAKIGDILILLLQRFNTDPVINIDWIAAIATGLYLNTPFPRSPEFTDKKNIILAYWIKDLALINDDLFYLSQPVLISFVSQQYNVMNPDTMLLITGFVDKVFNKLYQFFLDQTKEFEWKAYRYIFLLIKYLPIECYQAHLCMLTESVIRMVGRRTVGECFDVQNEKFSLPEFPNLVSESSVCERLKSGCLFYDLQDYISIFQETNDSIRISLSLMENNLASFKQNYFIKRNAFEAFPMMFSSVAQYQLAYVTKLCSKDIYRDVVPQWLLDLCYLTNSLLMYVHTKSIIINEEVFVTLGKTILENVQSGSFQLKLQLVSTCCKMLQYLNNSVQSTIYLESFANGLICSESEEFSSVMLIGLGLAIYHCEKLLSCDEAKKYIELIFKYFKHDDVRYQMTASIHSLKFSLHNHLCLMNQTFGVSLATSMLNKLYFCGIEHIDFAYIAEALFSLVDAYGPDIQLEKKLQEILAVVVEGLNIMISSDKTILLITAIDCLQKLLLIFPDCARYLIRESSKTVLMMMKFLTSPSFHRSDLEVNLASSMISLILQLIQRFPADIYLYFETFSSSTGYSHTLEECIINLLDVEKNTWNIKCLKDMMECISVYLFASQRDSIHFCIPVLKENCFNSSGKAFKASTKSFAIKMIRFSLRSAYLKASSDATKEKLNGYLSEIYQTNLLLVCNLHYDIRLESLLLILTCLDICEKVSDKKFILKYLFSTFQVKLATNIIHLLENSYDEKIKALIVKLLSKILTNKHITFEEKIVKHFLVSLMLLSEKYVSAKVDFHYLFSIDVMEWSFVNYITVLETWSMLYCQSIENQLGCVKSIQLPSESHKPIATNFKMFLQPCVKLLWNQISTIVADDKRRDPIFPDLEEVYKDVKETLLCNSLLAILQYCGESNIESENFSHNLLKVISNDQEENISDVEMNAVYKSILLFTVSKIISNVSSPIHISSSYIRSLKILINYKYGFTLISKFSVEFACELLELLYTCFDTFSTSSEFICLNDTISTICTFVECFKKYLSDENFSQKYLFMYQEIFRRWPYDFSVNTAVSYSTKYPAHKHYVSSFEAFLLAVSSFSILIVDATDKQSLVPVFSWILKTVCIISNTISSTDHFTDEHRCILLSKFHQLLTNSQDMFLHESMQQVVLSFVVSTHQYIIKCEKSSPSNINTLFDINFIILLALLSNENEEFFFATSNITARVWELLKHISSYTFMPNNVQEYLKTYCSEMHNKEFSCFILNYFLVNSSLQNLDSVGVQDMQNFSKYLVLTAHKACDFAQYFNHQQEKHEWIENILCFIVKSMNETELPLQVKNALMSIIQMIGSNHEKLLIDILSQRPELKASLQVHHTVNM